MSFQLVNRRKKFGISRTLDKPKNMFEKRDLPAICVVFGIILVFCSIALLHGWRLDFAEPSDLVTISGPIEIFEATNEPKAIPKLHIYVRAAEGIRHITLDDLSIKVPRIKTLHHGDEIKAMVKKDLFGRDLYWLWELGRGNETILTYDESRQFLLQIAGRLRSLGYAVEAAAFALIGLGLYLRVRLGFWSSKAYKKSESKMLNRKH
jgi:hypothetical protein